MTIDPTGFRSVWTFLNKTSHTLGFVEAQGVRTRFIEAGSRGNPTVLLLHGTAGSLENFCANYEKLAENYHVIGLDLLGCGYTDKPDFPYQISDYAAHLIDFMDVLAISRASLIGVSLGSWIGAWTALHHPDRVSSLSMLAPAGIVVNAEEEKAFGADVRKRRSTAAADPTWETVSTAMGRLMLDQKDLIDDLVAVRLGIYQEPEMKKAMPHLLAFTSGEQMLTAEQWSSVNLPLLVIASVDAPNMFLDNAYKIAQLAPQAQLVELEGCDHWPQFEQPEAFHQVALDFLARHSIAVNS
ncbi:alpha/beta fold hydrolase [Glutamicibacter sp.]|uniref:alpha/beta fold hydrolase n=1 Tax=Glutamicibacter sp. TaxID=1931995 RepID=UPI002FD92A05